jgi:hypothetical protein
MPLVEGTTRKQESDKRRIKMKRLALVLALVIALVGGLVVTSCIEPPAEEEEEELDAPSNLTCNAVSGSQIDLTWDASAGADGYYIYRCTGANCTPTDLVHEESSTSWSDTGLTTNTTYRYRVTAYKANAETDYSATVDCTTLSIPTTEDYGLVMGKVTDTAGNPLGDVTIMAGGESGLTNEQGWFSISNVAAGDRVLVKFSRSGYATAYKVTRVRVGVVSWLEVPMGAVDVSQSIDAASGGSIATPDGGMLDIGANSLVDSQGNDFSGTAVASLTVFDPSVDIEADAFPGEYLGVDITGEIVPIKSFGFMDVSVTGNGELQLAPGKNAAIRIPVPDDMQLTAQSMGTCPLWYFDTETGYWREEGEGTYDSASGCFVGIISHFSVWNWDVPYPCAYIKGRVVVGFDRNPVAGAQVKCWSSPLWSAGRWNSGETCTPPDGSFYRIPVEADVRFECQASKGTLMSPVLTFGPFDRGTVNDVGDIVIAGAGAADITITLTWGQNPSDLDSHLAATVWEIIAGANISRTLHVYWDDKGSLTSDPYAQLDTDDQTSFGPETISITNLFPGKYRYSVRHYVGAGTIDTSGAAVDVVIGGVGIFRVTPPPGQPDGTDIWRVIDMIVDVNGNLIAVNPINDYVTGDDMSPLLFP